MYSSYLETIGFLQSLNEVIVGFYWTKMVNPLFFWNPGQKGCNKSGSMVLLNPNWPLFNSAPQRSHPSRHFETHSIPVVWKLIKARMVPRLKQRGDLGIWATKHTLVKHGILIPVESLMAIESPSVVVASKNKSRITVPTMSPRRSMSDQLPTETSWTPPCSSQWFVSVLGASAYPQKISDKDFC